MRGWSPRTWRSSPNAWSACPSAEPLASAAVSGGVEWGALSQGAEEGNDDRARVDIASLSGLKGVPGQTNYSAAKGAMIASTKALSQEIAKRKITVNAVAPGFIASDMTSELNEDELKRMVPANRFGLPEEVANLVSFLASDKAAYITGEVININGGIYA